MAREELKAMAGSGSGKVAIVDVRLSPLFASPYGGVVTGTFERLPVLKDEHPESCNR